MYRYRADGLLGDQHHSSGGLRATSLRSAETKLGQNTTHLHTLLVLTTETAAGSSARKFQ